jgi:hypothetical protein
MYEKPKLERFGTFRELTLLGIDSGQDAGGMFGLGCDGSPGALDFAVCPAGGGGRS